jgi:hypothetical protein
MVTPTEGRNFRFDTSVWVGSKKDGKIITVAGPDALDLSDDHSGSAPSARQDQNGTTGKSKCLWQSKTWWY